MARARAPSVPGFSLRWMSACAAVGETLGSTTIIFIPLSFLSWIARACGVSVSTPPAGDVAGSLAVLMPERRADLLLGTGGTPEGVMSACAARALGGGMQGRPAPQRDDERERVLAAGICTDTVLELDDLVASGAAFVATGVTGGDLLSAPSFEDGCVTTESLVIAAGTVHRIRHTTTQE